MRSILEHAGPRVLEGPGGLAVDVGARRATASGVRVELSGLEFDLLTILLDRRGEVVHYDELGRRVWGYEVTGALGSIQTTAYRLRGVLDASGVRSVIRVVRGVGYTIDTDITEESDGHPLLQRHALEAALRLLPAPTILVDPDGHVVLANLAMSDLFEAEVETLERLPSWLGVLADFSRSAAQVAFGASLRGDPAAPVEVIARGLHGLSTNVSLTARRIADGDAVIGVIVTLQPRS